MRYSMLLVLYTTLIMPSIVSAEFCKLLEAELAATFHQVKLAQDVPSTLLMLKLIVDDALRRGVKAPEYNLCDFAIEHTNLFCEYNKGIPRVRMPQLRGIPRPGSPADALVHNAQGEVDATNEFARYIETEKGYTATVQEVPLTSLKATQNEIVGSKVAGLWFALKDPQSTIYRDIMEVPLFVSQDGYILDGHHRWAALVSHALSKGILPWAKIKVKRISKNIEQLLADAHQFANDFGIQPAAGITG